MNVIAFISSKKENWSRLESLLDKFAFSKGESITSKDFRDLSQLYRAAAADYAYAKTHFPEHDITFFLNRLVGRAHSFIYQSNRFNLASLRNFLFREIPGIFWQNKNLFLFSLSLFIIFGVIGFTGSEFLEDGERIFLHVDLTSPEANFESNARYITMTEENIKNGNPFGVYEDANRPYMSTRIMFNNIRVVFYAFTGGIFAGLITFWMLAMTGMMVGAFAHIFYRHGIVLDFWNTVLLHGMIELSMVVVGSTAGFMVARGLLFPGTWPWKESIRIQGFKAIRMAIAIALFLVIAGILEGFVTGAHLRSPTKLMINCASLLLLTGYWGVLGYRNRNLTGEKTELV